MKFIKLTLNGYDTFMANINEIGYLRRNLCANLTKIYAPQHKFGQAVWAVRETPEQIMALIKESKCI